MRGEWGGTLAAHFNKFVCFYYWEELDMHTYTPTYLMNLILEILYGTEKKKQTCTYLRRDLTLKKNPPLLILIFKSLNGPLINCPSA